MKGETFIIYLIIVRTLPLGGEGEGSLFTVEYSRASWQD